MARVRPGVCSPGLPEFSGLPLRQGRTLRHNRTGGRGRCAPSAGGAGAVQLSVEPTLALAPGGRSMLPFARRLVPLLAVAALLTAAGGPAAAQVVVPGCYAPAAVPVAPAPVVSYYAPPAVSYYA